jgi:hypothetical protein
MTCLAPVVEAVADMRLISNQLIKSGAVELTFICRNVARFSDIAIPPKAAVGLLLLAQLFLCRRLCADFRTSFLLTFRVPQPFDLDQ